MAGFAQRLRRATSATRLLAAWCAERGIGEGPIRIERHARPIADIPTAEVSALLDAEAAAEIRHRCVTLRRGAVALSDCDIWWLPARLDPAMQAELDATDHPFGLVVAQLHPTRRILAETVLPSDGLHALEHRALLLTGDAARRPFALVQESYRQVLVD